MSTPAEDGAGAGVTKGATGGNMTTMAGLHAHAAAQQQADAHVHSLAARVDELQGQLTAALFKVQGREAQARKYKEAARTLKVGLVEFLIVSMDTSILPPMRAPHVCVCKDTAC